MPGAGKAVDEDEDEGSGGSDGAVKTGVGGVRGGDGCGWERSVSCCLGLDTTRLEGLSALDRFPGEVGQE